MKVLHPMSESERKYAISLKPDSSGGFVDFVNSEFEVKTARKFFSDSSFKSKLEQALKAWDREYREGDEIPLSDFFKDVRAFTTLLNILVDPDKWEDVYDSAHIAVLSAKDFRREWYNATRDDDDGW